MMAKPELKILLAAPRGFCAGVDRAIQIVELALEKHGRPIYVRHEIVHNQYVVSALRDKGAVFIDDPAQAPRGAELIYSAHGVSPAVRQAARDNALSTIDATCPLVTKVHNEVKRLVDLGYQLVMIGPSGHVGVEGTMGQAPGRMLLVETTSDVAKLVGEDPARLGCVTQTTLSVDDTRAIMEALRRRFPDIVLPKRDDICYATQNRQDAVKQIVKDCDLILVVGSQTSSNSTRLKEIAEKEGLAAFLIDSADEIQPAWVEDKQRVGVTAGASAPEVLVEQVVARLKEWGGSTVTEAPGIREQVVFSLPKELAKAV